MHTQKTLYRAVSLVLLIGLLFLLGTNTPPTNASSLISNNSGAADVKFIGTVMDITIIIAGFTIWTVEVQQVISGPPISGQVTVDFSYTPWFSCEGTVGPDIEIGDKVEVYGLYANGRVSLCESAAYYIIDISPTATILGTASVTFQDIHLDLRHTEVPLRGALVSLLRNGTVVTTTTSLDVGTYRFEVKAPNAADSYRVRVTLADNEHSPPIFQVHYADTSGDPPVVYAETPEFKLDAEGGSIVQNVNFSSDAVETDPAILQFRLSSLALIYYHIQQAADFITSSSPTGLDVTLNYELPVEVYVYDDGDKVNYQVSDSSIHIGRDNQSSGLEHGDRPMNREWHEMFHHLMQDSIGIPPDRECNHGGFYNSSTADSWAEGWAIAWATILQDYLDYPENDTTHLYHWGFTSEPTSLEINYRAWEKYETRWTFLCYNKKGSWEDFAVAALIWDLYDSVNFSDRSSDWYGDHEDWIDLTTQQLWNALTSQSTNSLNNIRDLYESLKAQGIGADDTDKDGKTDLDEVFIMHGFYADDEDHNYEVGEEAGWGGKPNRRDFPHIPGTAVEIDLVDVNGTPLSCDEGQCPSLWVEIGFDSPNDYFSYAYDVALSQGSDNLIGLVLPPTSTIASANVSLLTGGNPDETFTMDNHTFWSAVATTESDHIAEITLSFSPTLYLPIILKN